jgi:hypothetical protein
MSAILQVVGDSAVPTTGDVVLHDLLVGLGHTVTYVSDEVAENTTGFAGVVIANSCTVAALGTKYNTCALPVVFHESGYVSVMRLADVDAFGSDTNLTLITQTPHPILNGPFGTFTGTVSFMTSATIVMNIDTSVCTLGTGVVAIATHPTVATLKLILACDSGDALATGAAPNKRVFMFPHEADAGTIAALGTNILKNAYTWAFSEQALLYWTRRKSRRGRRFTTLVK